MPFCAHRTAPHRTAPHRTATPRFSAICAPSLDECTLICFRASCCCVSLSISPSSALCAAPRVAHAAARLGGFARCRNGT
jgi:hypothetical protein